MDEEAWDAALRANPNCYRTLGAYIDWLDEAGRPDAVPYRLLFDAYGTAVPALGPWADAVWSFAASINHSTLAGTLGCDGAATGWRCGGRRSSTCGCSPTKRRGPSIPR